MRTIRMLALCALVGGVLAGCQSWPQTEGEVSVSRPQVFTRERLVNERLGEVNWLRDQLDKPFEQGFQGFRDVREAAAFVIDVKAKYDRALRRSERLDVDDDTEARLRQREIADVQHEIKKLQFEQQLDAMRKATGSKPPSAPVPAEIEDGLQKLGKSVDDLGKKIADLESRLKTGAAAGQGAAIDGLFTNAQSRVLNPRLAERSGAGQTSRDRLEDEAAYRDFVNARIREASLDDTHDLNGFALYELKFDATIVPGSNTRRSAVAELTMLPATTPRDWGKAVGGATFMEHLRHRIQEDVNALVGRQQERLWAKQLSRAWWQRIVNSRVGLDLEPKTGNTPVCLGAELRNELEAAFIEVPRNQSRWPRFQDSAVGPVPAPSAKGADKQALHEEIYSCLIAEYVRQRLQMSLGTIFKFELVKQATEGKSAPRIKLEESLDAVTGRSDLVKRLNELQSTMTPWVATVAPKEYAQNISDVASHQQIRQLGALLNASDGNAAAVEARFESYKQSQSLAHAIKRQPLAASFVRGDNRFGWVLGPKYEIKGSRPEFVQTTSRYTFTASVAVPGWHDELWLSGCGHWVEGDGSRSAAFPLFSEIRGDCASDKVRVLLPENYRAVFHALLGPNRDIITEPEIRLLSDADPKSNVLALRATPATCAIANDKLCEQQVVIEGTDLWRNPVVFIGNQRADRVDVLPSMRGIVATFRSLRAPPVGRGGSIARQDLFVSTSAGQDRLEEVIFIGGNDAVAGKPFARLSSPVLELTTNDGLDIGFRYVPSSFPQAYSAIALRVRRAGTSGWKLVEAEPRITRGELVFSVAGAAALGFDKKSGEFDCDLVFRLLPGDDWISMTDPSAMRAMYYANKSERELSKAAQASADFSSASAMRDAEVRKLQQALLFELPPDEKLFFRGYPGLEDALAGRGGSVSIELQPTGDASAIPIMAERVSIRGRTQIRANFAALHARALDLVAENEQSITYTLAVSYRRGGAEPVAVIMASGVQLTIKGTKKPPNPINAAAK